MKQEAQKMQSKQKPLVSGYNEDTDIKNVLELVDHCNPDIHLTDIRVKHKAKGSGGMLHVVAVQNLCYIH